MRQKWMMVSVLLLLLVSSLSSGALAGSGNSRGNHEAITLDPMLPVHPYLQYGAQVEPERRVRILVQKTGAAQGREIARAAGVAVLEEFEVARTLVMEVPQRVALHLARVPGVRYISYDGPVRRSSIDPALLKTVYPGLVKAVDAWNGTPATRGAGVTVAVLDTGLNEDHPAMGSSASCYVVNLRASSCSDSHGHGTHVAGTITGHDPQGRYVGIAPEAEVIGLKIADDENTAAESDVLRGLQWIFDNRAAMNIRVVNLSVSAAHAQSYLTSPLTAAVEQLWHNGVVVVAAAGNRGAALDATWFPPGNDPFVISVGALDDNGTASPLDDSLAGFSSRGLTQDGFYKPEIVAPGRRIVSPLASSSAAIAAMYPERIVDDHFIRLSGTSMSAPVVSGAVALLLERFPALTPNQVKWLLTHSSGSYPGKPDAAGLVDIQAALQLAATGPVESANQGVLLNTGVDPLDYSVGWGQAYWDQAYWDQAYWDQAYWDTLDQD